MSLLQAIILGLIQGITEFIPVSSSGHLILLPKLAGWQDQGVVFDALLHGATLLALIIVLWKDLVRIARGFFGKEDPEGRRLAWWLIIGSIPAFAVGFFVNGYIENLRDARIVAVSLIFWGVILWLADKNRSARGMKLKSAEKLGWRHAVGVGIAQAIALIPGTSRSGITITAGLAAGLDRREAVRFSFLLGIPVFIGATLLKGMDAYQHGLGGIPSTMFLVGAVAAFISGVITIKFLLRFVVAHHLTIFVWYRIALGLFILYYVS